MDLNNSVDNKVFRAGDIFTGIPTKIKDFSNTIKVAYHGTNGTLRIYQSPNGKLWSYYEEFNISGNSYAQSGINGNYYYVKYTNVTGTNTVTLATNLSQQIHDNFNVQLDSNDTVTVAGLLFNEDGALIVSSTGGGVSSDVNVTNTSLDVNVLNQLDVSMLATAQLQQESNIAIFTQLADQTDRILYDTDIIANRLHDIQGSVSVTNQIDISALATSAKQDSMLSDLDAISNSLSGTLTVNVSNPTDVSGLALESTQSTMATDVSQLKTFILDSQLETTILNPISNYATETTLELIQLAVQGTLSTSVENQIDVSALATSAKQDSILSDLDTIANALTGSLSVNVENPTDVSALATSAKQDSILSDLDAIVNSSAAIQINTTTYSASPVHLDLDTQGSTAWADSTLPWIAPANGENGWQYQNKTAGGAQCYFYANSPALVSGSQEPNIALGSVTTMYFVGNHRLLIDGQGDHKFYITIYTQPTGSGDAQLWYHSRKVYQTVSNQAMSKGADYLFYVGTDPIQICPDLEHIALTLASQSGDCNPAEIVQFMGVNVDSQVPQYQFDGVLKQAGFKTSTTTRVVVFDNSISKNANVALSKLNINESNELSVNVANQLTGFTFNESNELLVSSSGNTGYADVNIKCDDVLLTQTSSGTKNCLDVSIDNQITNYATETTLSSISTLLNNNLIKCDTDSVIITSGSVSVSGDVNITNSSLAVTGDFYQATQPVSISSSVNVNINDSSGNGISSLVTAEDGRALNNVIYAYDAANDAIKRVKMGEGSGLYVENAPATSITVGKGLPTYFALYTGALNAADNFGDLTVADYSTCDIMVKIPANACTAAGYLYVSFSEDGTAGSWYDTSIGVNINTSVSDKTYWLNVPSFCMTHISLTGRSPWGSGTIATTNSIIRICAKK